MKEASGEFSMTLVVIVGAILIVGILGALRDPITEWIETQWQGISDTSRVGE